jgi:hypothetical protein
MICPNPVSFIRCNEQKKNNNITVFVYDNTVCQTLVQHSGINKIYEE